MPLYLQHVLSYVRENMWLRLKTQHSNWGRLADEVLYLQHVGIPRKKKTCCSTSAIHSTRNGADEPSTSVYLQNVATYVKWLHTAP
jgi:hypothetical protein